MGGCHHQRSQRTGAVDNGLGQSGSFHRISTRTQLVDEDQGIIVCLLQNAHNIHHMGGECGQRLCDGLLVTNISQHPVKDPDGTVGTGRNVHTTLSHQGEQTDGFQGNRLAAGVGAGDHQGVKLLTQAQVVGHRFLWVQQGVARAMEVEELIGQSRLTAVHLHGQVRPCKDGVQ